MRIRLLSGRFFTPSESMTPSGLVVINATLARQFFPRGSALGQHIKIEDPTPDKPTILEIIGVVADVQEEWGEARPPNTLYMPYNQLARTCPGWQVWGALHVSFVARTASDPGALGALVRRVIGEVDRDVPIEKMRTVSEFLAEGSVIAKGEGASSLAEQRFYSLSIMALSGLGVLLAAVGIYGVVAFSVGQRTHEIGVRLALGAAKADVYNLVVGQGAALALCGVGVGLVSALSLTRYLASFLYGLSPTDLTTFAVTTLILLAVALLASLLPARRATKVDPVVALRYE
jgi:putative ABC transport system permease protein